MARQSRLKPLFSCCAGRKQLQVKALGAAFMLNNVWTPAGRGHFISFHGTGAAQIWEQHCTDDIFLTQMGRALPGDSQQNCGFYQFISFSIFKTCREAGKSALCTTEISVFTWAWWSEIFLQYWLQLKINSVNITLLCPVNLHPSLECSRSKSAHAQIEAYFNYKCPDTPGKSKFQHGILDRDDENLLPVSPGNYPGRKVEQYSESCQVKFAKLCTHERILLQNELTNHRSVALVIHY